ncbi:hypothetical protein BD413DRAFT_566207 [Trametes elegans]|nr:hypothetical protein BD413DRAFT_566207 [Trametes elegans]
MQVQGTSCRACHCELRAAPLHRCTHTVCVRRPRAGFPLHRRASSRGRRAAGHNPDANPDALRPAASPTSRHAYPAPFPRLVPSRPGPHLPPPICVLAVRGSRARAGGRGDAAPGDGVMPGAWCLRRGHGLALLSFLPFFTGIGQLHSIVSDAGT